VSVGKDICAIIGALGILTMVAILLSLVIQSARAKHRERARQRRFMREATADLAALDDPAALIEALRKRSEGKAT
jgi:hypothetical protein